MAEANHIVFRKGKIFHQSETPWNGVYPPKFGPVKGTRSNWCKPVDVGCEPKEGDIIICTFAVITTNSTWASEDQHATTPTADIKKYWHYVGDRFVEVNKKIVGILAHLKHMKSVKGDPSKGFYVRVPCDNDGYREEYENGKRKLFGSRQAARAYCKDIQYNDSRAPQIVHPCGGIEIVTFESHASAMGKKTWKVNGLEKI